MNVPTDYQETAAAMLPCLMAALPELHSMTGRDALNVEVKIHLALEGIIEAGEALVAYCNRWRPSAELRAAADEVAELVKLLQDEG